MPRKVKMTIKVSTIKDKFVSDVYCAENITIDISSMRGFTGVDSSKEKEYKGNYFIMDMNTFLFFHTMHEGVAQYLLLKEIIKDLQIVPILVKREYFDVNKSMDFYLDILKPFGITKEDIIVINETKPTFEKVYYYVTKVNSFLEKLDIPQGKELYNENPFFVEGYKSLRKLYSPYIEKDKQLPKKIFFTRLQKNDGIRNSYKLYLEYNLHGGKLHDQVRQGMSDYGSIQHFEQMLRERYISREEELLLEDYFIKKGYTIINPENLTFFEQINYYYNATHIVSQRGAALLNTLFCDPGTNIFILDLNVDYNFPYREICDIFDHNAYEIPFKSELKKYMATELFSVKNILGIINSHYSDKI
jgi:hypothetical protein